MVLLLYKSKLVPHKSNSLEQKSNPSPTMDCFYTAGRLFLIAVKYFYIILFSFYISPFRFLVLMNNYTNRTDLFTLAAVAILILILFCLFRRIEF